MDFLADIFLVAGALGAGLFCLVLARRLKRFNDLEKGVGGAVAALSAQVDDLNKTLEVARVASDGSNGALLDLTERAEQVSTRLELMMASLHDVPAESLKPDNSDYRENGQISEPVFVRHERQHARTNR